MGTAAVAARAEIFPGRGVPRAAALRLEDLRLQLLQVPLEFHGHPEGVADGEDDLADRDVHRFTERIVPSSAQRRTR
ncbi:hypothetical protein BIV23_19785 [Streptomyces monashensis]|uniref:Uncharacterized protein n=1 Tax=Streptomyces monashensis TaxID=1678012 RepID=A0A1S2QCB3_9ACTN|nr:hypothetical protein BIV23_19785 [Streptomyces monashensis]